MRQSATINPPRVFLLLTACAALLLFACKREPVATGPDDMLPPIPPAELRVDAAHDGFIALSWQQNREIDISFYRVYRAEEGDPNDFRKIGDIFDNGVIDLLRSYDSLYYYCVTAVDLYGNESARSAVVSTKSPNVDSPFSPDNFEVYSVQTESKPFMRLVWTPVVEGDLAGYNVYRGDVPGVNKLSGTFIGFSESTLFDDTTARAINRPYYYAVIAVDRGNKESGFSGEDFDLHTDAPQLLGPLDKETVYSELAFRWNSVPGAQYYQVRITSSPRYGDVWIRTISTDAQTEYVLYYDGLALSPGNTYYWRVITLTKQNGKANNESETRVFTLAP